MTDRMKPYHLTDKKSQMVRFLHLQRKIVLQNQRGVDFMFCRYIIPKHDVVKCNR